MKTVQMGPLSTFKQRAAHIVLGLGLAATLAFGAVMPAMAADDGTGTIVLTAGTRSALINNFSFGAKTLNGSNQLTTATPAIAVVDPTGSSLGWTVTMGSTAFASGGHTLVAAPRVTSATLTDDNASAATHTNGVTYATPVDVVGAGGLIATSAVDATSNGAFTLTPTIEIDIPYNTEFATYTSTITVTINVAP